MLLLVTGLIIIATILMIGSKFHAMAALAFVSMVWLVQLELLSSAAESTLLSKARSLIKFMLLTGVSAVTMSCSRYVMQVFTTLVEYSSFLPYREYSPACNDDGVDFRISFWPSHRRSCSMRASFRLFC